MAVSSPRRRGEAGYTLVELLVAAALTILLSALTGWLLADARTTIEVSREKADVQQRGRVALESVGSALREAGTGARQGPRVGPLLRWVPPVWPGRGDRVPAPTAITTLRVLTSVQPATLAGDAPPGTVTLAFDRAGCPLPCGFFDHLTVIVFNGRGDFDLFALDQTDGATASVRRLQGGTAASYTRGAAVLPVEARTYYWNAQRGELRAHDGDRGDFPVVNDVVDVGVEYVGEPAPPAEPRPPLGEENCLYDSAGAPRAGLAYFPRAGGTFAPLGLAVFQDGPWCGTGAEPFDADLLRIRAVRVRLRLQAGNPVYRGIDARWFRTPGTATDPARTIRDIVFESAVTPRNLGGWR